MSGQWPIQRPLRAVAGAAVLLALALAPSPARAAMPLELQYDAFVIGFPAVTFRIRYDQEGNDYRISSEGRTNGIADWFAHYRMKSMSDGIVGENGLKPTEHESTGTRRGRHWVMRLDFDGDTVHARTTPPDDHPMTAADLAQTIDPLTAIVTALRKLASTGACAQRIKVFDGRERYDLVLTDSGDEKLDRGFGIYSGAAHRCVLQLIRIKGTGLDTTEDRGTPAQIWFGPPAPGAPAVPVRIDFHTRWGDVGVWLSAFREGGAAPASAAAR